MTPWLTALVCDSFLRGARVRLSTRRERDHMTDGIGTLVSC